MKNCPHCGKDLAEKPAETYVILRCPSCANENLDRMSATEFSCCKCKTKFDVMTGERWR